MEFKKYLLFYFLVFVSFFSYSQKLYIAENGAQQIQRSNTDGTVQELISSVGAVGAIRDIVIDEERNMAFWIEAGSPTLIKKAPLEAITGTVQLGPVTTYVNVSATNFQSLVINPQTRELLVSNNGNIYKISLDLTFTTTVLPAPFISGYSFISGFDIDLVNSKIYFIRPITTKELWIGNLSGTGLSQLDPVSEALDVKVDPTGGKLYLSTATFSPNTGKIVARDITTGANPVTIVDNLASTIRGIALDLDNGYVFWADGTSAVGRAKLDGTGKVDIFPGLNAPFDVALDFSTTAPPKLYWTEGGLQEIHRINTNGSDFERYYFGSSPIPAGIAIDQKARYVYWTAGGESDVKRGVIGETDFDSWETLVNYPIGTNGIQGIALDPSNHMMYFAYAAGNKVQRADFNDTPPIIGTDIDPSISNPYGVALDLVRRKIYYTSNDLASTNTGTLKRANLDGTGIETLITQTTAINDPPRFMHDVKVDAKSGTVYWVFTQADGPATIYKASVNNVSGTVTPLIAATSGEVRGIEIDPQTDKLWWVCRGVTSSVPPGIMQANLSDGSGISVLHQVIFTPPRANFIALDRGCEQPIAAALFLNAPLGQSSTADPVITSYHHINDIIQVSVTQVPTKGVATLQPDGKIFYSPNNGTVGADIIGYEICNQCGLCDQATINVTIPNVPPVIAPPASIQIENGAVATIPLTSLLSDPNNNLDISSLTVITPPASGAGASFNANNDLIVDYTGITFSGVDNLTIEVCDLADECTTSVISITVDSPAPPVTPGIVVYTGMSPNGDKFNPFFRIANIETAEPQNKVSIYNRWGDKVFEVDNYDNNDPKKRFNGESDKGKALPSGVYFYKIEFASGTPELEGYLTLKR